MTLAKGSLLVSIIAAATIGSIGCGGSNNAIPSSTATSKGRGAYFETVSKVAGADAPDLSGYSTQTLQFAVFNIDDSGNYYAVGAGTLSVTNSGNCS